MFYCSFNDAFGNMGMYFVFLIAGGILIFVGMYLLSDTADGYLSPCLEFLTERLSCNESLAGVTLLAFGNGAPDVFGAIASAGDPSATSLDANEPVCILIGGTFFISTVVIFLTARATNTNPDLSGDPIRKIKVTPQFFIRDIIFFMLSTLYLLFAMLIMKQINFFISIGFILIYTIYVIIVVVQSKNLKGE
jgi:sodium/potassium/calcium exchanger 6